MNERINELAEQAGITTNLDTDYYEKDMNKWVDYFSEKFAELIVRECIDIAQDRANFPGFPPNDVNDIIDEIKEHFGVEE